MGLIGVQSINSYGLSQTLSAVTGLPFEVGVGSIVQVQNGVEITVLDVEDSRCPADVQCIWQGEAKVHINVKEDSKDLGDFVLSTLAEKMNQSFENFTIRLIEVQPYPYSTKEINASDYSITLVVSGTKSVKSPMEQYHDGVSIEKIVCSNDLHLIMKKSDGRPACVRADSIEKLIQRGWGIHVLPEVITDETQNSDIFELGKYQITTEMKSYNNSTGFLARPIEEGNFPGVILIHEWWGLNDNIKDMARNLASHGYTVFAADLYAGQVAATSDDARKLVTTFNVETGVSNLKKVEDILRTEYDVEKLATIGWCFGGAQSMNYALSGNNLDATIIFYGQLVTDKQRLSVIDWPVMGVFGGQDQSITVESVNEFKNALDELGIENDIHVYQEVGHAFANPTGANYSPDETKDAWHNTIVFLETHLNK